MEQKKSIDAAAVAAAAAAADHGVGVKVIAAVDSLRLTICRALAARGGACR